MPVIVANVKEKSLESALKKAESSLINGYKQLMARESIFKVSSLPIMSCARNASCFSPWHKSTFKVVDDSTSGFTGSALPEKYALPQDVEVIEDGYGGGNTSTFSWSNVPYLFRTADGMSYGVEIEDGYETFSVYADINGKKSPNTVCKDMLKFRISGVGNISNVCGELAESTGCSINNLSACNGEQCRALYDKGEYATTVSGLWNMQGHFVSFWCNDYGVESYIDWCTYEYTDPESLSAYCR